MAKVREYDFTTGIETSTVPDPGTPTADNDTISLGYLNDKSHWGAPVASYTAMRALTTTMRSSNQVRKVTGTNEYWYFDSASTGTDDGATILKPDDNPATGRWLIDMSGGGGGGGGGSGIDQVLQKLENERFSIFTSPVDNSGGLSTFIKPLHKFYEANLLKDYVSGAAAIEVVWNGKAANDSDKNYDSATGWTATGAAASVGTTTTSGQFTVGTAAIKFDKNSSATQAGVRYDRTTQDLSLADQTRAWIYFYLPSVTGLSNVYIRVYADSTSNYQEFTATLNYAGGAFATGLNLVLFDISTGGTAGGTGWDQTKLSRYIEAGVTTSSAGQTYTGVAFDALYFSYRYPERLRVIGSEFDVFDNSIRSDIKAATSNTKHDGPLTLSATVASNIAGGLSGTSRGRVMRSTLLIEGDGVAIMDNDSSFSGAITTTQDLRTGFVTRSSISGTMPVVVDALATQFYTVTTVGGSTIGVSDPEDTTANLKNGDSIDVFHPYYQDGKPFYTLVAALSLTADSTASSGTTTLTLTTAGIAVGDVVCKRHVNTVGLSMVTESSLESFSAIALDTSPDGVQLIETGLLYPNSQYVYAHWKLGGNTSAEATRNQRGGAPNLTVLGGGLNYGNTFKNGQRATSGWAAGTQTLYVPAASADGFTADSSVNSRIQFSLWMYFGSISSGANQFITHDSGADNDYFWNVTSGGTLAQNSSGGLVTASGVIAVGQWYHLVLIMQDGGPDKAYVNGTLYTGGTVNHVLPGASRNFLISGFGNTPSGGLDASNLVADVVVWRNGPEITLSQVIELYNQGRHRIVGSGPLQRYKFTANGQTGQRATVKARLTRTTTAIRPIIAKVGTIVT